MMQGEPTNILYEDVTETVGDPRSEVAEEAGSCPLVAVEPPGEVEPNPAGLLGPVVESLILDPNDCYPFI